MAFKRSPKVPGHGPGPAAGRQAQPAATVRAAAFVRPLDYWLHSDAARMAPAATASALRDMAWAYGQWLGFRTAVGGLGTALVGGSGLALATAPDAVALWLLLLLAGLALVSTAWLVARAKLPGVVRGGQPGRSRAVETAGSGLGLALFVAAFSWILLFLVFESRLDQSASAALTLAACCLLSLLGCLSVFAGPGYCAQNGRRFFRRRIERDSKVRAELEALSLDWRDPVAERSFGPL